MTTLYEALDSFLKENEITFFSKEQKDWQGKTPWSIGIAVYTEALALAPDLPEKLSQIIPNAQKTEVHIDNGTEYSEAYSVKGIVVSQNLEKDFDEKDLNRQLSELNRIFNTRLENARTFSQQVDKIENFGRTIFSDSSQPSITIRCSQVPLIDADSLPNKPNNHHSVDDDPIFQNEVAPKIVSLFKKYGVEVNDEEAKSAFKHAVFGSFKIPPHAFDKPEFAKNGKEFQKDLNKILRIANKEVPIKILEREYGNSNKQVPPEIRKNLELKNYALTVFGESVSEYSNLKYNPNKTDPSKSYFAVYVDSKNFEQITSYLNSVKSLPTTLRNDKSSMSSDRSFNLIVLGGLLDKINNKGDIGHNTTQLEIPVRLVEALKNLEPEAEKLAKKIKEAKALERQVIRSK